MINLSKPEIGEEEIKAVIEVLKSGWLTHGPKNEEFEKGFAKYIGTKYAITMNSCASALHLALLVNGIKAGDEVIVPSFTHVATANAALTNNAKVVFADIDLDTFNIDPNDIERKITDKTKAIIPVDFAGSSCDMKRIMEIIEKYNLILVEDTAEACGTEWNEKKLGSFGIGCFSFFPIKNMTTGEGGMLTTSSEEIYNEAYAIMGHGMDKSAWARSYAQYPWQRIQKTIGYNFRMSNILATIGVEQLKKLEKMNEKRRQIAKKITNFLKGFDCFKPQLIPKECKPVYQMYTIRTINIDRNKFLEKLKQNGVGASVHFDPPVHLQPYYQKLYGSISLPKTEMLCKTICTLPMYPSLSDNELNEVFSAIEKTIKEIKI